MQQIEVYLDHNAQLELVGVLNYEQLRGNATYHFSYDANWLSNHPHLSLSGDCNYIQVGNMLQNAYSVALRMLYQTVGDDD